MRIVDGLYDDIEKQFAAGLHILRLSHELGRSLITRGHEAASKGSVAERMALFFIARAAQTLNAFEVLFCAGLERHAEASLRTPIELLIDFDYIWADKDSRLKLFAEHVHVANQHKLAALARHYKNLTMSEAREEELFRALAPHAPSGVTSAAEMKKWREAEYARISAAYKGHQWSKLSVKDRAIATGKQELYDIYYGEGSEAVHSNPNALASLYEIKNGRISVSSDPSLPRSAHSIVVATALFHDFANKASERMGLGTSSDVENAHRELLALVAGMTSG